MRANLEARHRTISQLGSAAAILALSILMPGPAVAAGESPRIVEGSTVTIDFSVSAEKKLASTTEGKEPLSYVQGQGQIVPGLEKALLGLKAGDRKRIDVPPDQAYGPYDDSKRLTVARNRVPGDAKVGSILQDKRGEPLRVVEMTDTNVVLDRNHPLAGKVVTFDVKILNVEPPEGQR